MNKVLLLKRAACSSALLSLVACGSSNSGSPSSSSSVSSVAESSSVAVAVSSAEESSSEAASSVVVVASSADYSSSSEMSSEAESSSSAPATANLLKDSSFESGMLNGDYWQTNIATISTDMAYVTDGASGVSFVSNVDADNTITRSYIEMTLPEGELVSGGLYFVSMDAKADAAAEWKNWDVELFANAVDGIDNRVELRTFNQLGINTLGTSGEWYERAVAFPIPSSTAGLETKLRITGVEAGKGAIDNANMQEIDTFIVKYDFEDGDVSDFTVSDGSTLTTNTANPINGSTSLSFTPTAAQNYIDLPLEEGAIQSGKRYVITLGFGISSTPPKAGDKPFLVHFIDTVSKDTIGKSTYNYAYFAGGAGSKLSAAFIIDVDRDQSSDVDWGASSNIVLRAEDLWDSTGMELLLDDLTISEIKE